MVSRRMGNSSRAKRERGHWKSMISVRAYSINGVTYEGALRYFATLSTRIFAIKVLSSHADIEFDPTFRKEIDPALIDGLLSHPQLT